MDWRCILCRLLTGVCTIYFSLTDRTDGQFLGVCHDAGRSVRPFPRSRMSVRTLFFFFSCLPFPNTHDPIGVPVRFLSVPRRRVRPPKGVVSRGSKRPIGANDGARLPLEAEEREIAGWLPQAGLSLTDWG